MATDQFMTGASSSERRVEQALAVVDAAAARGATARILGGVGVVLHCGAHPSRCHREPEDIDLVASRADASTVATVLADLGHEANTRFNAMHGDRRQIFSGPAGKVDVFIGAFTMCHRLDLEPRLTVDTPTISVADLVLTKLQVVELSEKDVADLRELLHAHDVADGPGDWIDAAYIAGVLADDWGYWRTARLTLDKVIESDASLAAKADALWMHVDAAPKTRRFRVRARIGERRRWYDLPEAV